ncbi:adhesion G-protein coupled receptor F3-like [Spea bombifrons]|uniref:adhesion G-protein coupled receptor F3-like n=1 Tax=Spea bombifrons TaxID=233779 RepID=UPI00234A2172|nr:adhesion G-protein coupled receptor F3-like [Spea bombifrons]
MKHRIRRQLSTAVMHEYMLYTDVLLEGSSADAAESFLMNPTFLPYSLALNSTLRVTLVQLSITTECNVTDTVKSCACKAGYRWNITVCHVYQACNGSSFCSCILVPDDNIPFCEREVIVTTQKVNLTGSFTLNEIFTVDLQDQTSPLYKAKAYNITLALLDAYTRNCNLLNVSVVGFSPGSVVANYRMMVAAPVSSQLLEANSLLAVESIPNAISSQLSTSGISAIQPEQLTVKYWDRIQLSCQINETLLTVNWTLVNNNSSNIIYSAGGNVDISTRVLSNAAISTLTIIKADQWWQGTYVCQFFNGSLVHEAKAQVNVTLLPTEIFVNPIQKSLSAGETSQPALECCVPFDGETYDVSWSYGNVTQEAQPSKRTDLRCYTLAPPPPAQDTIYSCVFTNNAGQKKENSISITVIQAEDPFCTVNVSSGVTWNVTKAGTRATANCPSGRTGNLTRHCSLGGVWLTVQDNCISQLLQSVLDSAKALDQGLGSSQVKVPEIIQQLSSTEGTSMTNAAEVSALVNILETIAKVSANGNSVFDSTVVTNFLSVASNLTDTTHSSLWKQDNSPQASQVLQSVERFSLLLQAENGTIDIVLPNIQLKGSSYQRGSPAGHYEKTFDTDLGVSAVIGKQTISSLLDQNNVTITSVVFNTIGNLLPANTGKFNNHQLNSIVQSTSVRLSDSSSFSGDIFMTFGINNSDAEYSQRCVFWDFQSNPPSGGSWSDSGCTSKVERNKTFCSCTHLTSFAVLMSINVEPLILIEEITLVGLGVSILSLCVCVCIEWAVWKSVVRTNISYFRHISLVNISLSLMFADVCFLSSAFPAVKTHRYICLSITFLNHFFYLALFFWTFCQSMMLLHQLLFVFHHLRKKVYVSFAYFMGYFIPAFIAAGTFLYFKPKETYMHEKVCWLNPGSGAIYAFAIPAGSIIVFNFITLIVVIAKLSRPSVSDANTPEDRETAKSILKAILVLTPVFGLTWSFGFALLTDLDNLTRQVFTYGFAGMNAFQGFFILLTCLTERKVREALCSKVSSTPTSTTTVMSVSEAPSKTGSSLKKEK